MKNIFLNTNVLWSQVDANRHLRHSAYADFAAQARIEMLQQYGMNAQIFEALNIGPILFREELIYHKEVLPGDSIKVTCALQKCRPDGSRWSFEQGIYKNENILAATIHVDGAWIDVQQRKLTKPPAEYLVIFLEQLPQTPDFKLEIK